MQSLPVVLCALAVIVAVATEQVHGQGFVGAVPPPFQPVSLMCKECMSTVDRNAARSTMRAESEWICRCL